MCILGMVKRCYGIDRSKCLPQRSRIEVPNENHSQNISATSKSKELLSVLQANGIHFEENRFVCGFDIGECEDHEKHILELCKAFHATDIVHAEYSQDEYQAASWYTVRSQWHYPNGNEK